jgi:hypothetical protein
MVAQAKTISGLAVLFRNMAEKTTVKGRVSERATYQKSLIVTHLKAFNE